MLETFYRLDPCFYVEMTGLIANGATIDQIAALSKQQGTKLLRDNVSELVQLGNTTIDELVRVTYAV